MKEAVFCSNMMLELDFDEIFGSVPLFSDNTSALHVAGNRTYSPRAKHIALRYFFVQELVEEGKISIHCYFKTEDQLVDLSITNLSKHCHLDLKLIDEFKTLNVNKLVISPRARHIARRFFLPCYLIGQ